jgi:hypothetical protein
MLYLTELEKVTSLTYIDVFFQQGQETGKKAEGKIKSRES